MRLRCSLAAAALLVGALLLVTSGDAGAAPAEHPKESLARFAAALTSGNSAAARVECTDALWARIVNDVEAPGGGTFVAMDKSVGMLRADLATGFLLWTHPDGVQDLLQVTLVGGGSVWRVCGGLGGGTPARPLQR